MSVSNNFSSPFLPDRFIPNRIAMETAKSSDTYFLPKPFGLYQKNAVSAIFPFYSSKTLHFKMPEPYQEVSQLQDQINSIVNWKIHHKLVFEVKSVGSAGDYYYHPLDWGARLVYALHDKLYDLNSKGKFGIDECIKISKDDEDNLIVSVKYSRDENQLALGSSQGELMLCDSNTYQQTRSEIIRNALPGIDPGVYCLSWRPQTQSELSISVTGEMLHVDTRISDTRQGWICRRVMQEEPEKPCSLDWHQAGNYLARGDNNNQVVVYDIRKLENQEQIYKNKDFRAGVKGLKWCPYEKVDCLMAGAGSSDRRLQLLLPLAPQEDNYQMIQGTNKVFSKVDTRAQVCDLTWLDSYHVLIASGFAASEQLSIWKINPHIPSIDKINGIRLKPNGRMLNVVKSPVKFSNVICADSEEFLGVWNLLNESELSRKRKREEPTVR